MEAVLYALPMGIMLSLAAGPVFFVVIETSISKGKAAALSLDIGAILADLVFISLAFFGSKSLLESLKNNLWVTSISGLLVCVFGVYYILKSRQQGQFRRKIEIKRKRLFFVKGFLLNFLNIGVLIYWITTTVMISNLLDNNSTKMWVFYASVLGFYLAVDLLKIFYANRFKERLKGRTLQLIERIIGFVILFFGLLIVFRNLLRLAPDLGI